MCSSDLGSKQIEQQGGETGRLQDGCDELVAGAEPRTSAAVHEHDDAGAVAWHNQITHDTEAVDRDYGVRHAESKQCSTSSSDTCVKSS